MNIAVMVEKVNLLQRSTKKVKQGDLAFQGDHSSPKRYDDALLAKFVEETKGKSKSYKKL